MSHKKNFLKRIMNTECKINFDRVPKKPMEFYGFIRYGCSITPFSFIQTRNITGFFDKRLHLFLTPFLKDFNRFFFVFTSSIFLFVVMTFCKNDEVKDMQIEIQTREEFNNRE